MSPACVDCGKFVALRFDQGRGWVCSQGCGNQPKAAPRQHGGNRATLFEAYVVDNGQRRRATRSELREAWRLWAVHKDIRENRL